MGHPINTLYLTGGTIAIYELNGISNGVFNYLAPKGVELLGHTITSDNTLNQIGFILVTLGTLSIIGGTFYNQYLTSQAKKQRSRY